MHAATMIVQAGTGASSRGAEKALTEAQLVDLPNTGAFVLPLAAHSFLVGLLVIEQIALLPHLPADNNDVALQHLQPRRSAETALGTCFVAPSARLQEKFVCTKHCCSGSLVTLLRTMPPTGSCGPPFYCELSCQLLLQAVA